MSYRRRRHDKSRSGCLTCKTRHVKCDELRPQCRNCNLLNKDCHYLDNPSSDSDGPGQMEPQDRSEIPLLVAEPEATTIQLYDGSYITSSWPEIDVRLYYAGTQLVDRMARDNGHLLTVGTAELPTLHRMGYFVDHVRYAMLALRSGYFAKRQKSLKLDVLHRFYKTKAISLLQNELSCFSQHNSDSILGASLLLWFGSEDQKEEEFFIQGTSTVIQAIQPWKSQSILPTYVLEDFSDGAYWSTTRTVDVNSPPRSVSEPVLFADMLESVRNLYTYVRSQGGEVKTVVKLFLHALNNLRAAGHTAEEQAKVRTTLRLYRNIGRETLANIGSGTPGLLATVAHFELMQAYIMAHKGVTVGFSAAHMRTVERISRVLNTRYENLMLVACNLGKGDELSDVVRCIELIGFPLRVAADFNARGRRVFME